MRYGHAVVTWAIPVQAHLLGARLEAYVEHKATISTLRLCAQNGNLSEASLAKLPLELMEIIVGYIQQQFFEERLREWVGISDCVFGRCHDMQDREDHNGRVERHLNKLGLQSGLPKEGKRFCKCRETFTQDFGLEAYFDRNRNLGYITFPLLRSNHLMDMVPGVRSFSRISNTLEPSVTTPPTIEQKALFQKAMKILNLKPIGLKDDLVGATFLHLPSLTIKEQGSHACNGAGCLARFDTALDLQVHQVLGHPKFSTNFLALLKDIDAVDLNTDACPKLMALLHWMLAPTPHCNFTHDD